MYYAKIINSIKVIIVLINLVLLSPINAAVFIVDDNYDGVNNSSACEQTAGAFYSSTITNARISASTNTTNLPHTIRICPGTYSEDNSFNDPEFIGMSIEGTSADPALVQINNVDINASVLFLLENNMSIKNLSINGGRFGIRTSSANSAQMNNLILSRQTRDGIRVQSADNRITNTLVEGSDRFGIFFNTAGDTLHIESTKVVSAGSTCIYSTRGNETFIDISVDSCGRQGILMINAAGQPENLTLTNINISNTAADGLYIRNYDASAITDNVNVSNIRITNSERFAVYLLTNTGINLSNIVADTTTNDGIAFNNTSSSTFNDISINNAGGDGLYFNTTTTNNKFTAVSISNSAAYGFFNNGGDDNAFEKLIVTNSSGIAGIYYTNQAVNNIVKGYESNNNNLGVYLNNAQENTFATGDIHSNNDGVRLIRNSSQNQFIENYIHDNSIQGLSISATGINENNVFLQNCFINPIQNINNQETGVNNLFDNGAIGNFYGSSPAGSGYSETCLDADSNSICDLAYTIPNGVSGDVDNFPSRDLSSINSACFSNATASPEINFKKTSEVFSDPINNTTFAKAIPGAIIKYTLNVTNSGLGNADSNSIVIADELPTNTKFVFGTPANPVDFLDGTPSSGLSYTFTNLSSTTDDIEFSNDGGTTFITPSVDVDGVDISSPLINFIKITPKGVLNGESGSGSPNFSISYKVKID